jgi:hypothetical protein
MAKYYGKVGYAATDEIAPGVYGGIIERSYYGDVLSLSRRLTNSGEINDSITINNEISIVADPYAFSNFVNIRYVTWMGQKWKVSNVKVEYPRIILSIGDLYNGE